LALQTLVPYGAPMPGHTTAPFVTTYGPNGMVCSIDNVASSAGVAMLRAGGSAVDAAIATSAVLAVTCQHMCGMGGDLWALVHVPGDNVPLALNASGRAGSGADPARARAEGLTELPMYDDIRATPVPGCVDGWTTLHDRLGKLDLSEVLGPAIGYATNGFPASPLLLASLPGVAGHEWAGDYTHKRLRAGDLVRRPGVHRTLEAIAVSGRDGFYEGEFGAGLMDLGAGEFTEADLERSQADWVDPISVNAWGNDVWTVPPNSQGYLSLAAAWIADGLELPSDPNDGQWAHLLVEAAKQAGFDRPDVLHDTADGRHLVSAERLAPRRAAIDAHAAAGLPHPTASGDTMYMCAVDADRMGVSLIQSNAGGWGSGLAEPRTRIFLQNRGLGFNLIDGHPGEYGPARRPSHTLAPALVTKHGRLRTVLGTMGGDSQPQIVLQMLARLLDAGESPAKVIASGRWRLFGATPSGFHTWADPTSLVVQLEGHAPTGWEETLRERGHNVSRLLAHDGAFGHAHLIDIRDDVLAAAADPRSLGGAAVGF